MKIDGGKTGWPSVTTSEVLPSALRRALHVPFSLNFTLPSFRKTVTAGLLLLMLGSAVGPVTAAAAGTGRIATTGAPITWVQEQTDPAAKRFEAARPHLDTYAAAVEHRGSLTSKLSFEQKNLPYIEANLEEARAKIEGWALPDTTGLESFDAELLIQDANAERAAMEREVESIGGYVQSTVETIAKLEEQVAAADVAVDDALEAVTPFTATARRQLDELGLQIPMKKGPNNVGFALVIETWEGATGLSFADLSPAEQAWFAGFERWATSGVDAVVERFRTTPPELLRDVVRLSLADQPTDEGIALAGQVASELSFSPNVIDMNVLARLGEDRLAVMTSRLKALEDVGLTWTDDLRVTMFNGGPGALTDFTSLTSLSSETPKFWIDPPAVLGARSVQVEFDALLTQAKAWTEAGRPLTADAVPLLAILARGGDGATRTNALLERVDIGAGGAVFSSLANLATGQFADRGLDAAAIAALDEAITKLGRPLQVGEANAIASLHFDGGDVGDVLATDAVALAQKHDPRASMDDLYVWSVAAPKPRAELIESIASRIGPGASRLDRAAEYSERFADHVDTLSNSDLMRIDWLLDAFGQDSVRAAVGQQIDADLANAESELGGRFIVENGAAKFDPLSPERAASNNSFEFPSSVNPYESIVTVHFHATVANDNERSAGPSSAFGGRTADRAHAREAHRSDLVIVHLGDGRFGVDYYTPEGAVVDLGTFSR